MPSEVVEGLGHRGEAVGGAGGRGDDVVISGQDVMVDVEHDGGEVIARRSGDDDLLGAGVDVSLGLGLAGVETGALQHDVDVELAPRELCRVSLGVDGDLLAVDLNEVLASHDGVVAGVVALRRVVLQEVSKHLGGGEVVDSDDLGALMTKHLTEGQAADATKAVDSNLNCHTFSFREAPRGRSPRQALTNILEAVYTETQRVELVTPPTCSD